MTAVRVLLVDDHKLVRAGIRRLLDAEPDLEVIGEATNGHEALVLIGQLAPDVVLLDVAMPGLGGLEALRQLRANGSPARVLVLTMLDDEAYVFQAIQAGADGYVLKDAEPAELLAAVRAVARGAAYLHPAIARPLLQDYLRRVEASGELHHGLTEREREVLRLTAAGRTAREIAAALHVSPSTVERHRSNLMAKLKLHNRAELIRYALERGLLEPES
jgi:two-component system response regulator NreC